MLPLVRPGAVGGRPRWLGSGRGQLEPCDADRTAEHPGGMAEGGEPVSLGNRRSSPIGKSGPSRVNVTPSVLWGKVPGRAAPGRMAAPARSRTRPPEVAALASSQPVSVVFRLLSMVGPPTITTCAAPPSRLTPIHTEESRSSAGGPRRREDRAGGEAGGGRRRVAAGEGFMGA